MNATEVTLVCATSIIVCAAVLAAFFFGCQHGYWKRVGEEKEARGIK